MTAVESGEVVQVITTDDAIAISVAMRTLKGITEACDAAASVTPSTFGATRTVRAQDYGRLAMTAKIAADLLFDVLNVGNAYCEQDEAMAQYHAEKVNR